VLVFAFLWSRTVFRAIIFGASTPVRLRSWHQLRNRWPNGLGSAALQEFDRICSETAVQAALEPVFEKTSVGRKSRFFSLKWTLLCSGLLGGAYAHDLPRPMLSTDMTSSKHSPHRITPKKVGMATGVLSRLAQCTVFPGSLTLRRLSVLIAFEYPFRHQPLSLKTRMLSSDVNSVSLFVYKDYTTRE
jgi:hypothetical protein